MECPIATVIREIRGGRDDAYDEIAYAGAADLGDHTAMFDSVDYYLNTRRVEIARFELGRPPTREIMTKYREMFGYMAAESPLSVLASRTLADATSELTAQAGRAVSAICDVEAAISRARAGATLPCSDLGTNCAHQYEVFMTVRALIDHINAVQVPSIAGKLEPLAAATLPPRAIPAERFQSRGETMKHLRDAAAAESAMCSYLRDVEKYYVVAAGEIAGVISRCTDMLSALR